MILNVLNGADHASIASGYGGCGSNLPDDLEIHEIEMKVGIQKSTEWAAKGLAEFTANVGVKCGHGCTYCSSKATMRTYQGFKEIDRTSSEAGFSMIDPNSAKRISRDAKRHDGKRGRVQFCSIVDGWAEDAQSYDLGRECVEGILKEPDWTVRVLTKNAAVRKDFDLFERYRDRVLFGMSVTATPRKQNCVRQYELRTSPIQERMDALIEANRRGLRTYAMLCPLLPGIASSYEDLLELIEFSRSHGAEEIFVEAINGRSDALPATQEALAEAGYSYEADQIRQIRHRENWSRYAADLAVHAQEVVSDVYGHDGNLRYLMYGKNLTPADESRVKALGSCVKWLGT